ncbi:hypothetical protein SAMN05216464_112165 [Mucilaginibacter pineti]|uniref:Lipoprotein n=1 Tax=Mucilaginibacter pineti TaxID=1391627 RepID=A0A1G7I620_9SPHI|nr:hypothetical protein [Mucilaginibacter pineti]SDF08167.1 hypothetical protein SAMN05216464_112165 [Mucilaginibacter pineti]
MKKLITITLAVIFTGAISSCKREISKTQNAGIHSFANCAKRDLGCAD